LRHFLDSCRLIPWLTVTRTDLLGRRAYRFAINEELKAVCEGKLPITDITHNRLVALLKEVDRRRKEARAEYGRRKWNAKAGQSERLSYGDVDG
jgi:hypothetical protein